MPKEFTEIRIDGVNADDTVPRNDGTNLWNVRLKLSPSAPLDWWLMARSIYGKEDWFRKRRPIDIDSHGITINGVDITSDSEVDQYRAALADLVAKTNVACRALLKEQERAAETARIREAAERDAARKLAERWNR